METFSDIPDCVFISGKTPEYVTQGVSTRIVIIRCVSTDVDLPVTNSTTFDLEK